MKRHSLTRVNVIELYKQLNENYKYYTHVNKKRTLSILLYNKDNHQGNKNYLYIYTHNHNYTGYGSIMTLAL